MSDQRPDGPKGIRCPHMGGKDCSKVCRTCMHWMPAPVLEGAAQIPIERWGCAINWIAIFAYQSIGATKGVTASVDKVANVMADGFDGVVHLANGSERQRAIGHVKD
jgi:hypothetical protein